jgi:hypothetical protein
MRAAAVIGRNPNCHPEEARRRIRERQVVDLALQIAEKVVEREILSWRASESRLLRKLRMIFR